MVSRMDTVSHSQHLLGLKGLMFTQLLHGHILLLNRLSMHIYSPMCGP